MNHTNEIFYSIIIIWVTPMNSIQISKWYYALCVYINMNIERVVSFIRFHDEKNAHSFYISAGF